MDAEDIAEAKRLADLAEEARSLKADISKSLIRRRWRPWPLVWIRRAVAWVERKADSERRKLEGRQ